MNNLFNFLLIVEIVLAFAKLDFDQILQEKYTCPANCVDIWGDCQQYLQYCHDPKKGAVIRAKCPCTCQVCSLSPTSTSTVSTTTPQPTDLECRPVNLIFVLDTSQSIDGDFFNTSVRAFVKMIAAAYPMLGEINEPSSQISIVEFASEATVTYPLVERTRSEFMSTFDQGVYFRNQGIKHISLGLETALNELMRVGIGQKDNVMVILMTDDISTLDIKQTKLSANRVRAYTNFFAGVGIDGINGNEISSNLTNLQLLLGNQALAFANILHAENPVKGIWSESRQIYPCPVPACKGVIFIGEMTEVLEQKRKEILLNSTKRIAKFLNSNAGPSASSNQLQFAIATFGNGTIRPIKFQTFFDFNSDLDSLIQAISANNNPDAGQTDTSSILNNLYNVVITGELKNYLVLFMGETELILDIQLTDSSVKKLVSTSAEIFVLDMTNGNWNNDYLFKNLVKNDQSKIYNYSSQSVADLTNYYTTGKFAQIWSGMTCAASLVFKK